MTSTLKTGLLLGLLTAIIMLLGGAMGGQGGIVIAFGLALIMNAASYWYSDKIILKMYKVREVSVNDAPGLHRMVEELAREARIPKPKICVIEEDAPNAFATGRGPSKGVVAVTTGITKILTNDELRGVLAHEIGHIKNRDILIQSAAAVLGGAIMYIANIIQWTTIFGFGGSSDEDGGNPLVAIALAIIAPMAAMLIQMAISRTREYGADRVGAAISHNPESLASALEKISAYAQRKPMQEGNAATAHMFIVNPLAGKSFANLFSTHPPVEERVKRLRGMGGAVGR